MTQVDDIKPSDQNARHKRDLHSMSHSEIVDLVASLGQPKFRVKQIEEWVWEKNASTFDDMTNLPKTLRQKLGDLVTLGGVEEIASQTSVDGSRKYL